MKRNQPDLPAFGHTFLQEGNHYHYDVGSNEIFEVDPVLAAVLPLYGPLDADGVVAVLGSQYPEAEVRRAVAEIEEARVGEGLFRVERPEIAAGCETCLDRKGYGSRIGHLTLTVTERCTLRCKYCLHGTGQDWIRPHGHRRMALATALKALHFLAGRCGEVESPHLSFYGGEPLLEFDLIQAVVREARSLAELSQLRITIDTNGTLLDDRVTDFVTREKIHLQISLDGPPRLHDRYRRAGDDRPTHDQVMAGLDRVLRRDPGAADRMSFIVTAAPPYDIMAIAEYFDDFPPFRRLGIESPVSVRLNLANLDGLRLWTGDDPDPESQLTRSVAAARERYVRAHAEGKRDALGPVLRNFFDGSLIRFHHRSRSSMPATVAPTGFCQPGQRRLHVRADGSLQPCERVGDSQIMGHVDRGIEIEVVERMFSELFGAVRDECRNCWAVRQCGLCFTTLGPEWDSTGQRAAGVDKMICKALRDNLLGTFRLFLRLQSAGPEAVAFLSRTSIK